MLARDFKTCVSTDDPEQLDVICYINTANVIKMEVKT